MTTFFRKIQHEKLLARFFFLGTYSKLISRKREILNIISYLIVEIVLNRKIFLLLVNIYMHVCMYVYVGGGVSNGYSSAREVSLKTYTRN